MAGTLMPMRDSEASFDEAAMLARLRSKDEAAFDELVDAAAGRMLAVARKMMPTEADAEDAVQDAFLSAFKSLDRFDGRSKLTTWLHQITVNACLMKLRSRAALTRYADTHRRTTLPIYLGTNAIVRLFTDDRPPARLLRGAVLRVASKLPPLKAAVTRQLTGDGGLWGRPPQPH